MARNLTARAPGERLDSTGSYQLMSRPNQIVTLQVVTILSFSILGGCASPPGESSGPPSLQHFEAISNANCESLPLVRLTGHDQQWFKGTRIAHSGTDSWLLHGKGRPKPADSISRSLYLAGVTSLTIQEAEVLASAKKDVQVVYLPDLLQLDSATAKALAQQQRAGYFGLHLCGLVELDAATMKHLAGRGSGPDQLFCLDGVTAMSSEVVVELQAYRSWGLSLSGLKELNDPVASWLSRLRVACLCLNGIKVVDADALDQIESWPFKFLYLNGLTSIDPPLAHALMTGCADLYLNGLETIDRCTAAAFRRARTHRWQELSLEGLVELSDEAARELAVFGDLLHASEWVHAKIAAAKTD